MRPTTQRHVSQPPYGFTVSPANSALINTDALIPLRDVQELHANSPLASTYVEYGIKRDLYAALEYWSDTTGVWLLSPGSPKYTLWIRAATGRLCIKIGDSFPDIIHLDVKSLVRDPLSRATSLGYLEADLGQKIISKLQLDDIHVLLCSRFYEMAEVTLRSGNVTLGTIWPTSDVAKVIPCPSLLSFSTTITREDIIQKPWWYWENGLRKPSNSKDVIRNGWTRITLPPNMQKAHHLTTHVKIQRSKRREMQKCWLSQANLIGRDHGIAVKDYWIPAGAKFRVSIWCPEDNFTLHGTFMADAPTSEIYLFVFKPAVGFVGGYPVIEFPHVRDALYWSFDSRGRTRLTAEMAERIGVPYVFFESWVTGISWSQKDYDTLAEFHSAKGCDPFSCDVTVKLGYPILEHKVAAHTSLSEIDQDEVEYAKRELKTYPKQVSRCATVRCPDCGGRQLAVQNVVLPDIEVPPIHRHRHYRNVFIRTDTTLAA